MCICTFANVYVYICIYVNIQMYMYIYIYVGYGLIEHMLFRSMMDNSKDQGQSGNFIPEKMIYRYLESRVHL